MNIQEAKQIKIADYLQSLGYLPVKQQGNSLWYKSPFRQETEASFKVNINRNLWFDYGLGKGGNIIALAQELYSSDHVPYLLHKIAEQTPHVRAMLPTVGGTRTLASGIAPLLAGAWDRYRIGKTGVQGATFHKQR